MQTFQTAAVVGLIDNMSGPLKALSKQAAALAKEFTSVGKGANAQGMNAHVDALRAANREAREHLSILDRINNHRSNPNVMAAGVAGGALALGLKSKVAQQIPIEKQTLETMSRLTDYTKVSKATADELRRLSRIEGVKFKGGQNAYMEEGLGAAKMNMPEELLSTAARVGQQFGDFMHMEDGSGIEKLVNTAEYFDMFKNRKGLRTNPKALYEENLSNGMSEAEAKADIDQRMKAAGAQYMNISNAMPGHESQLFDAMKRAMPISQALNVPLGDTVAMMSMLATGGIEGSLQGTLTRAVLTRGGAPSLVSQAAVTAAGADPRQFMKMDQKALDPTGFVKALEQFYGPVIKGTKGLHESLVQDVADFKARPGTRTNAEYDALQQRINGKVVETGGKNKKGYDIYNSELVAKRVNKEINLANTSYDVLGAVQWLRAQGKFTPGLAKAMFGTEGSTAVLQMSSQDIDEARKQGRALTTQSTPELAAQWDKDMKARSESSINALEGSTNRVSALFDSLAEHMSPLVDASAKKANEGLDKMINAKPDEKTAEIVAGAGIAAGAGGAAAIGLGSYLGTGAIAATLATGGLGAIAIGGGLATGAGAYLLYKRLEGPEGLQNGDAADMANRRRVGRPFGTMNLKDRLDSPFEPLPKWEPPKEWPTSAAAIQNVTKDGALSAGAPPQAAEVLTGAPPRAVEVTGTVVGEAAINLTVTVNASPLLTSIVDQAKNAGKMNISGKLGTGLIGDGNATKASQPARTGASGGW